MCVILSPAVGEQLGVGAGVWNAGDRPGTLGQQLGNHDSEQTRQASGWTSSQAYAEISVDHRRLVLFHYGQRVWNGMRRNTIHLYGHSHGRLPGFRLGDQGDNPGGCLDAGVDCWGYRPVSLSEIVRRIRTLEAMPGADHHYPGGDDA